MDKYKQVIKRLDEEEDNARGCGIKILGDEKNKERAISILMHTDFSTTEHEEYHQISRRFIDLLTEAEIKFKILK